MIIGVLILVTQLLVFLVNCGKKKAAKTPVPVATPSRPPVVQENIIETETRGGTTMKSTRKSTVKGDDEEVKKEEEVKEKEDDKENDKENDKEKDMEKSKKEEKDEKKEEKPRTPSKRDEESTRKPIPHITTDPSGPLNFKMEMTSQTRMTLKNTSDKKIMFKIKFSDPAYQVNPVFGTIEPGSTADLAITHKKSTVKDGKMVIVNSEFTGEEKDLAKAFRNEKITGGQVTIKLCAS